MGLSNANCVLIVAAGTGGHLYPGIATARAILSHQRNLHTQQALASGVASQNEQWEIVFAVRKGDLGREILAREGFAVLPE